MAQDLIKYIESIFMPIKKCIVLDLDNTLWGDKYIFIIGEGDKGFIDISRKLKINQITLGTAIQDMNFNLFCLHYQKEEFYWLLIVKTIYKMLWKF